MSPKNYIIRAGYYARIRIKPRSSCPYTGEIQRRWWLEGYRQAEKEMIARRWKIFPRKRLN